MSNTQRMISDIIAIHNEAQRLCAAGPWVKIEPGCEMPEDDLIVLICINGLVAIGCYNATFGWWTRGQLATPTHYAVVRMPKAE